MSEEHKGGDAKFLFGFFLGGILGALIIFFLGTKEGKKAGKLIEEKGKDILDTIGEKVNEIETKGEELVKQGEVVREQVLEEIEEKKEELTESVTEKLDTALEHIEKMQEQGAQTTADLRKRLFKNIPRKK